MITEAAVSLGIAGLVIARAINILAQPRITAGWHAWHPTAVPFPPPHRPLYPAARQGRRNVRAGGLSAKPVRDCVQPKLDSVIAPCPDQILP
jgi:hypothetical protein